MESLIKQFVLESDISKTSKKQYGYVLSTFRKYLTAANLSIQDTNKVHLLEYKQLLSSQYAATTQYFHIVVLKMFYNWMDQYCYCENHMKSIKMPNRYDGYRKHALTLEQVNSLIEHLKNDTSVIGLRDFACINLIFRPR